MKRIALALLLFVASAFGQGITVVPKTAILPKTAAFPGTAAIAPTVVQSAICVGNFTTNPSESCVYGSNVVSGNILVIFQGSNNNTAWGVPTGAGTGCSSTTWTAQGTPLAGAWGGGAWIGTASGSGACTVTGSASSAGGVAISGSVYEVAGGTTTGIVRSVYTGSSCQNCTGNAVSSVPTNALVLTFIVGNSINPITAPSPFTLDINTTDTQFTGDGAGHYTDVAGGTYTPTYTLNNFQNHTNFSVAIPHP